LVVVPVPGFSKVFAPNPVPFNGTSVLTFTIDNTGSVLDATALDFTDNFPAGMTIATPSNAGSTCTGGTVIAVAGSGVVSYSGGTVAASTVCTVVVDVIGGAVGDLVNTCGDLTSSSGNSGPATDTLTVVEVPIFSKVFAPDQVALDGISTLTFTIDNSGGVIDATALDFTDTFPFGIYVATPSNAATTCTGGTLTATPDSDTVSYTGGTVAAGATCTVTVDVVGGQSGDLDNVSGDLTSSLGNSGPATDTLTVYLPPTFTKEFDVEFMGVGEIATITFTIDNTGSAVDATGLDFTDTFPAGMEVAAVPNPFTSCAGGAITAPAGATSISFTGGTVAAGSTCIVQIDITITASGRYVNTTEDLTSSAGNSGSASAILQAQAAIPTNTPLGIAILIAILGTLGVWQLRRWS
ncbi:MAG: hypothetical protein GY906_40580, partial [bacterium]|nr:hypothetical protein [bacterium]